MEMFYIAPSPIHRLGLFAKHDIKAGTPLFKVADVYPVWKQTKFGMAYNHSSNANTDMIQDGNEVWQFSVKDIKAGDEITGDYRLALPFFDRNVTGLKG